MSERLRRLEWIVDTQAMLAELDFDLDGFMETVIARVTQVSPANGVIIELVDGEDMVYRAVSPHLAEHVGLRLSREDSLSGLSVAAAEILYCRDAWKDERVNRQACDRVGLRSMVCVPLITGAGPIGVLKALSDKLEAFGGEDIALLNHLAKALATALAKQVAFGAMQRETEARRRAEISLRASEARANRIIDEAHHAIVTMDQAGRVVGWNHAAEALFGWTRKEAIGAVLAELIVPEPLREAHQRGLARFAASGEGHALNQWLELPALRKSGDELTIELAISATREVEGWRFTALIQDISARKAQTELFENAFNHAPIGIVLVGLDGRLLKVNDAFAAIVGYPPAALLDMDFQSITHPDDLDSDLALLARLTAGKITSYQMDKRYIRQDGSQVHVHLSVSMVRHPNGAPKHYIGQIEDMTARLEAEARYRLMAENTTDMIVTSRLDGRTTFVSAGCRALTGWTVTEAVGRATEEFVHPDDLAAMRDVFTRTAAGETGLRVRWRGKHKLDDRLLWLESSPSIMTTEAGVSSFLDVVRDVTQQVAQENALAAARRDAEAAAQAKSDFLANMSHEIRTPLTAVIGFSSMLLERAELDDQSRRFADRIDTAGRSLLAIVNDILDFSKLAAGEYALQPKATDAYGLAEEVLGLFQPQAERKGLWLRTAKAGEAPGLVTLDPQALRQTLFNLIGNAVKFTEQGGVTLSLDHRAGRLSVSVIDTGEGLSGEQQAKLFQRFSQVDGSASRRHGGTGLGLAISKALVEAMGGEIGLTSRPGEGANFHFQIPAPVALAAFQAEGAPLASIEGVRVLLVDNNLVNRELARTILHAGGAEAHEAVDGLEAVEAAQALPFDIILMDLRMPRLDGPSAMRRIREEPGPNQFIPILAFSAGASVTAPDGFDGAVAKPLTPASLVSAIADALAEQVACMEEALDVAFN